MAKTPSLGKLYRYCPRWWHQAEPQSLTLESFWPEPEPSTDQQKESRFKKLAEIALHGRRKKAEKQAA